MKPKRKYDLAVGLGQVCSCTQSLRRAGLQFFSFPYDWVAPPLEKKELFLADLRTRAQTTADRFPNWFDIHDFTKFDTCDKTRKDWYFNNALGLIFLHDFPQGVPLETSFDAVRRKYRRRIDRLLGLLEKSRRVLLFRLDRPDLDYRTPPEDCRFAIKVLSEAFPETRFDLLLIQHETGVPVEERIVEEGTDGLTVIKFDYKSPLKTAPAYEPDFAKIESVLKTVARVRDYRTFREKTDRLRRNFSHFVDHLFGKRTSSSSSR